MRRHVSGLGVDGGAVPDDGSFDSAGDTTEPPADATSDAPASMHCEVLGATAQFDSPPQSGAFDGSLLEWLAFQSPGVSRRGRTFRRASTTPRRGSPPSR